MWDGLKLILIGLLEVSHIMLFVMTSLGENYDENIDSFFSYLGVQKSSYRAYG